MEKVKNYQNSELINENFKSAHLPKLRNDFIAKLENAIMFLDYKNLNMWHSDARNSVSVKSFDGAWLMDVSLRHKENEDYVFAPFGDLQVTPDMFPKMNIKTLNLAGEIGFMSKYRFLNLKEKRNLENYRYIFSERVAFLDYGKQRWWTDENGYGFNKINKELFLPIPTSLKSGYRYDPAAVRAFMQKNIETIKEEDSSYLHTLKHFHLALQLSLTYYYEWACYIKEKPDSLGVRIPIHPSSSKEIFMMRNLPEGKTRKRAIVNFVKDHYRTVNDGGDNEKKILIKKHLRGDLKFNWRGLEVQIIPSDYDIKKTKSTKKFKSFNN